MSSAERIAAIEQEMARTQKNKAVSSFSEFAGCDGGSLVHKGSPSLVHLPSPRFAGSKLPYEITKRMLFPCFGASVRNDL
jgi:hypothetical protein